MQSAQISFSFSNTFLRFAILRLRSFVVLLVKKIRVLTSISLGLVRTSYSSSDSESSGVLGVVTLEFALMSLLSELAASI